MRIKGLTPEELSTILSILTPFESVFKFSFFGSRVTGQHRQLSDLDICYRALRPDLQAETLSDVEFLFEESPLSFKVDLVDFAHCDPAFQKIIEYSEVTVSSSH